MDKIKAQLSTQLSTQPKASSLVKADFLAISAQSVATSFGLYDGNALLERIAHSGILLSEPSSLESSSVGLLQKKIDLNI
jgi:hypothetical protein